MQTPVFALPAPFYLLQMSIPPPIGRAIPRSANLRYQSLKLLGDDKNGDVVLAIPRSGIENLGWCIALETLKTKGPTCVPRSRSER
jgi:hypothetical protein